MIDVQKRIFYDKNIQEMQLYPIIGQNLGSKRKFYNRRSLTSISFKGKADERRLIALGINWK